jgi:hypothetical protein
MGERDDPGFGRVSRAMEHLKEIEDFKRDC